MDVGAPPFGDKGGGCFAVILSEAKNLSSSFCENYEERSFGPIHLALRMTAKSMTGYGSRITNHESPVTNHCSFLNMP